MTDKNTTEIPEEKKSLNFIEQIVEADLKSGKHKEIITRFPPEPNGYLHIGHAKSIILNFGLGETFHGKTNLRFDDTNPVKEDVEYVDSILEDVQWLGYKWHGDVHYASDYFEQLYKWAIKLIKNDYAYVDDQSGEEISASRGTPTQAGKESPFRNRSAEENLDLFERMRKGDFKDGEKVLRAKIDMSSPNMHMRDLLCIVLNMLSITEPAINGAFIRCMISHTDNRIILKASHIQFVLWNLKTIVRYMIGF